LGTKIIRNIIHHGLAGPCVALVLLLGHAAPAREWSDATGMFTVEGELVAVRADKIILEKADGVVIGVPLEKLSVADREFVKSQSAPGHPAPQPAAARLPISPEKTALADQAQAVLKANCYRCHGQDGANEGGFNFALNLEKLAQTLVAPRNASDSVLFQRVSAADDSVMPPPDETPRPSSADVATIKSWIEAGAPAPPREESRELVTNDKIVRVIAEDVNATAERSRRFLRYFTLTHLYNAGIPDDELQTYRNAFAKLINSLSWNTNLVVPQTIDPLRTIFRIDMRDLYWNVQMWEHVEAANPYFLELHTEDANAVREATQCRQPHVRVDWFVFAASRPPLYHIMLGLPESAAELENMLRVNVAANIDQEQAIRAAFNRSGVSQNNRLIEWHKSPYGSYWKSYDFGGNAGRQNLFEYPLGPGPAADQFQHDGGELIYTLPNGLQAYLLVDGHGNRIDQGPTNIVSDPKRPDKSVTNGVSCMSCHYAGVIVKADKVGPAVRANRKAYGNADEILALYREPGDLKSVFDEDAKRFAAAMDHLGISSLSREGEPVSAMSLRFEQELDVQLVASEFGLSVEDFLERLDGSDLISRRFAALRTPGGVIKRDVFATDYREAAVELKLLGEDSPAVAALSLLGERNRSDGIGAGRANKSGEVCRFSDLGWGVKSLAFSPQGTLLAAGKPDRALRLFDILNEEQAEAIEGLELLSSVESCVFAPNGARLLTGGRSGHIAMFEVSKDNRLKEIGQFAGHSRDVKCIAISGDSRFALSGSSEKKARLWEIESGQEAAVFADFEGPVKACQLSRDGRTGLCTDGAKLLELDLSGKPVVKRRRQLTRTWASGQSAAISNDGKFVAVGDGYTVRLWNLDADKELGKMEAGEIQWSMAFTPDGSRLLTGGTSKMNIWDVGGQRRIHAQEVPESGYIQCLAASPDNKHAAAAGRNSVYVFRLPASP
jgi:mono/diheme cytochrome c family protein